ncbi:MAG: head-tail connector protein [Methanomassiliicoccales archaeon]
MIINTTADVSRLTLGAAKLGNDQANAEPITLEEAKAHLRVDGDDEDDLIEALITASREAAERFTGRIFMSTQIEVAYNARDLTGRPLFSVVRCLAIPHPPLSSVERLTWYDHNSIAHIMDPEDYYLDTFSEPGRLVLHDFAEPPTDLRERIAVVIQATVGYGETGDTVPQAIRQGMLQILGNAYADREGGSEQTATEMGQPIPPLARRLLQPYRVVSL